MNKSPFYQYRKYSFKQIIKSVEKPLLDIEKRFDLLVNSDDEYVNEMIEYIKKQKGKNLRSTLICLSSNINDKKYYKYICDAALAIELLHTATLIHDDVNDNAQTRRGMKTCHNNYGRTNTILFGDFLFSKSFIILSKLNNIKIINNLSETTSQICQGEIMQNVNKNNFNISLETYLNIIYCKTSSLIGESCRTGGIVSNQDMKVVNNLYQFGINLGMAFQIYDDYLDLRGDKNKLGKPVFNDLINGYITLPIIYFINEHNSNKNEIQKILNKENNLEKSEKIDKIKSLLKGSECMSLTLNKAKEYSNIALEYLSKINDSNVNKDILKEITKYIIKREY